MALIGWLNSIPRVGSFGSALTYAAVLKIFSLTLLDLSPEVDHLVTVLIFVMAGLVDIVPAWYRRSCLSNDMPVGYTAPMTTGRSGEQGTSSAKLTKEFAELSGTKKFSYEELMIATDSFAENRIVGRGGFGIVYEGHVGDARTRVAIKKIINRDSHQRLMQYISEVKALSQLMHINLVRLIGYCHEGNEFVLVYEFIGGGSLEDNLFKEETSLTWKRRYNIALGLASVLRYLHKQCHQCVIHRDIKSSNIMLDEEFVVKLGDFGLSRLVDHGGGPRATQVIGTLGYMAPEYQETGEPSTESDIYSFGVVLLEIVCGRRVSDWELAEQGGLVRWVWKRYGHRSGCWRWRWHGHRNFLRAVDRRLLKNFNKKQAEALMIVGLWCAHPIAGSRPSIEEAMTVLNLSTQPPKLPSKMPVFTYS